MKLARRNSRGVQRYSGCLDAQHTRISHSFQGKSRVDKVSCKGIQHFYRHYFGEKEGFL